MSICPLRADIILKDPNWLRHYSTEATFGVSYIVL